jgi:hypothetical protein
MAGQTARGGSSSAGGSFGGMTGSNGGMTGSNGGMTGSNGGMTGSNGGMAGSNGGANGAEPSAAEVCAAYAAAECDFTLRCGPVYFYQSLGTMVGCTDLYAAACLDRLVAPGVRLKPADVQACAEATAATTCALPRLAACRFQGTLPDGTGCAYDAQCSGGLCKIGDWFDTCGVCSSPAAAGEACHQRAGCQEGLQCSLARATSATCVATLAQGAACEPTSGGCARNFSCPNNLCQPQPRLGQACEANYGGCDQTEDSECLKAVCQEIVWHVEGESCEPGIGVVCRAGFHCDPVDGPGICHASTPSAPKFAADCQ